MGQKRWDFLSTISSLLPHMETQASPDNVMILWVYVMYTSFRETIFCQFGMADKIKKYYNTHKSQLSLPWRSQSEAWIEVVANLKLQFKTLFMQLRSNWIEFIKTKPISKSKLFEAKAQCLASALNFKLCDWWFLVRIQRRSRSCLLYRFYLWLYIKEPNIFYHSYSFFEIMIHTVQSHRWCVSHLMLSIELQLLIIFTVH